MSLLFYKVTLNSLVCRHTLNLFASHFFAQNWSQLNYLEVSKTENWQKTETICLFTKFTNLWHRISKNQQIFVVFATFETYSNETLLTDNSVICLHIFFHFQIIFQGGFTKEATTGWNCGKNVISCYQNIVFLITNRPMTKKLQAPFCCLLIESAPFWKKMASPENLHSKPSIRICELTFSPPIRSLTWSSGWMH